MTTEDVRSTAITVPEVPGILTSGEVLASARAIAAVQRHDGMIPWFEGGHCDPWNHVEAAMALTVCGLLTEAEEAYRWLVRRQLPDGAWFNYYRGDAVKDPRLDTNVCGYLAAGAWHHHLITGDVEFLGELWPSIEKGIDFILRWQQPDGSVLWSVDSAGRREGYALLTGSSSIYHSLRCAVAIAECLDKDRPDWELAAGRLGHAVAHHPGRLRPRSSSPWTGTTPCSQVRWRARRAGAASRTGGRPSSWRAWGCGASRRGTGSRRPRRPSAS